MENIVSFLETIQKITEKDTRYKTEVYTFVMEALDFTVSKLKEPRHVTGQELLEGIREYGIKQFGPMTRTVFEYWGVKSTEDFGEIVFNMVDNGLMDKTEHDSKDDFKNGYDFREVFDKGYRYELNI
ncbi:MAG: hypothetical protein QME40_06180 [bacterium]|nr:hypothetical protein [bacterium]